MTTNTATVDVDISAAPAQVWEALTDPEVIRKYFFGAEVASTWQPGSPITWSGEYDGRSYQDKGEVLECVPEQRLRLTHFSPLSGQEDKPENYHQLTYELSDEGDHTHLRLEQDNNATPEALAESQKNWVVVLNGLKECVERG
jgi:uncharacterized protein YndB with AHSA1/START domain